MANRCDSVARFFKVMVPETTNLFKLRVPDKFAEKFGHELDRFVEVILRDSIGDLWFVQLEKENDTFWFHHGWDKFVKDHSVTDGYIISFKYMGNSKFNVHVFDLTSSEIIYKSKPNRRNSESDDSDDTDTSIEILSSFPAKPCTKETSEHRLDSSSSTDLSQSVEVYLNSKSDDSDDTSVEILSSFPAKPCDEETSEHHLGSSSSTDLSQSAEVYLTKRPKFQRSYRTRSKVKMEEEAEWKLKKVDLYTSAANNEKKPKNPKIKNAREAIPSGSNQNFPSSSRFQSPMGAARNVLPMYPSFTVVLNPTNLERGFLYMPNKFYTKYMPPNPPEEAELCDGDGNKWVVCFFITHGMRPRFGFMRGLTSFFKAKNLKVGDTCVFELICSNKPLLKVSTF